MPARPVFAVGIGLSLSDRPTWLKKRVALEGVLRQSLSAISFCWSDGLNWPGWKYVGLFPLAWNSARVLRANFSTTLVWIVCVDVGSDGATSEFARIRISIQLRF